MKENALIFIEGNSTGNGLAFVRAARELSLIPIMLLNDVDYYAYVATEGIQTFKVNTTDIGAIINACKHLQSMYKITGILCTSEFYYKIIALVCQHFDLPGPDPGAVALCLDKAKQREKLLEDNVPIPQFQYTNNTIDAVDFAVQIGFPVVVKPSIGNGSTGVKLCDSLDAVAEHARFLLAGEHGLLPENKILVEEFAVGTYYCSEMMEGEVVITYTVNFGELPNFAVREFVMPAPLNVKDLKRVTSVAKQSIKSLNLGWGPANVEMRLTKSGPVVIEVNPRIGGAPSPELIKLACGVDVITETIKVFTGYKADISKSCSNVSCGRYVMPDISGRLEWIGDQQHLLTVPGVQTVDLKVKSETLIDLQGDWRDIVAHVIAVSSDVDSVTTTIQQAVDLMDWTISPTSL